MYRYFFYRDLFVVTNLQVLCQGIWYVRCFMPKANDLIGILYPRHCDLLGIYAKAYGLLGICARDMICWVFLPRTYDLLDSNGQKIWSVGYLCPRNMVSCVFIPNHMICWVFMPKAYDLLGTYAQGIWSVKYWCLSHMICWVFMPEADDLLGIYAKTCDLTGILCPRHMI